MEMDQEVDATLAQQLSCMGTSDRETLVGHFQQIIGQPDLQHDTCVFFLDMYNWNLQAAVGGFYDYGQATAANSDYDVRLLNGRLAGDVTVGEGESVTPNTSFLKMWRLENSGLVGWPEGCYLAYMEGEAMAESRNLPVPCVKAGGFVEVSTQMTSPEKSGLYQSRWQLNTRHGIPFGDSIWCIITVSSDGIMDIMQGMAGLSGESAAAAAAATAELRPTVMPSSPFQVPDAARFALMQSSTHSVSAAVPILAQTDSGSTSQGASRLDTPTNPPCTPASPVDEPTLMAPGSERMQ